MVKYSLICIYLKVFTLRCRILLTEGGDTMSKILKNEITCTKCDRKFLNRGIVFSDTDSLKSSTLEGNTITCPLCGEPTPGNKENMTLTTEEGTFNASKL